MGNKHKVADSGYISNVFRSKNNLFPGTVKKWQQFAFQKEMEEAYLEGFSGLLNAPTGSGKTFALFLAFSGGLYQQTS